MSAARKFLASVLACALSLSTLSGPAWAGMSEQAPNLAGRAASGALPIIGLKAPLSSRSGLPGVLRGAPSAAASRFLSAPIARPQSLQAQQTSAQTPAARNLTAVESLRAITEVLDSGKGSADSGKDAVRIAKFYQNSTAPSDNKDAVPDASGLSDWLSLDSVRDMIGETQKTDPQTLRLRDAVQLNGFQNVALNKKVLQTEKANAKYTVELPMGPVTDQKSSGRCWIFAALSDLAATLIAQGKAPKDFEFSQNYVHFFSMLEKSNTSLQEVINVVYNPLAKGLSKEQLRSIVIPRLGDGGFYEHFQFLVAKYGLVPKEAMGETSSSDNTGALLSELQDDLAQTTRELMANALKYKAGKAPDLSAQIKLKGMKRVSTILVTHLGKPPLDGFAYHPNAKTRKAGGTLVTSERTVKYTPLEFAQKFVKYNPNDYVVVGSFPGLKTGKVYKIQNSSVGVPQPGKPQFNVRFMNVAPKRFEGVTVKAIKGGQPVWFGADVTKDVDYGSGIMHPKIFDRASIYNFPEADQSAKLTRKEAAYFNRISVDHAMLLTGYRRPDPKKPVVKFKVANSWGETVGSGGIFHLYRDWFQKNVFEVIIHKRFLGKGEKKAWQGEAKVIENESDWY